MFKYKIKYSSAILLLFLTLSPLTANANDVEDSIQTGLKLYKNGKYNEAVNSLRQATKQIRHETREKLVKFLPKALPGWKSESEDTEMIGDDLMGAGVMAERKYTPIDQRLPHIVIVRIIINSPVLEGLVEMYSMPDFAAAYGKKTLTINGQKALLDYEKGSGESKISIVVAKRYIVEVESRFISFLKDTARTTGPGKQYATLINYKKLKALKL